MLFWRSFSIGILAGIVLAVLAHVAASLAWPVADRPADSELAGWVASTIEREIKIYEGRASAHFANRLYIGAKRLNGADGADEDNIWCETFISTDIDHDAHEKSAGANGFAKAEPGSSYRVLSSIGFMRVTLVEIGSDDDGEYCTYDAIHDTPPQGTDRELHYVARLTYWFGF